MDVVNYFVDYGVTVSIFDPWANPTEVFQEYGLKSIKTIPNQKFDAIILGVEHNQFLEISLNTLLAESSVIYDVKGILKNDSEGRL